LDKKYGSLWRRWDLHVHTPASVLGSRAQQYAYYGDWDRYLTELETKASEHRISVVGVTDYWTIEGYKRLRSEKIENNRLENLDLLIPNIEGRLGLQTNNGKAVNFHILIDPTDPNHIEEIEGALTHLTFRHGTRVFSCTTDGLKSLGAAFDPTQTNDRGRLNVGTNQFKPSFEDLTDWLNGAAGSWIRNHAIFGISNGSDGVSGLRTDSGLGAVRDNLQQQADVIFSGKPADREYYLAENYPPKPCIHGCDAQALFEPDQQRYCWIKAQPTFTGFRQILRQPEDRVWIGNTAPGPADPAKSIECVTIAGCGWFETQSVPLNPGLVAIVGEKGSGKTALAELIALAGGALGERQQVTSDSSFISRAGNNVADIVVTLHWRDGSSTTSDASDTPLQVRYLSQDFVEHLCSSDHEGRDLINELEGMVFRYIPGPERLDTSSFSELRDKKTSALTSRKQTLRSEIRNLNRAIDADESEVEKKPETGERLTALRAELGRLENLLDALQESVSPEVVERLESLSEELKLSELQSILRAAGLTDDEIISFKPSFQGSRMTILAPKSRQFDISLQAIQGTEEYSPEFSSERTAAAVENELEEAENLVSQDQQVRDKILQVRQQVESLGRDSDALEARLQRLIEIEAGLSEKYEKRRQIYRDILAVLDEERKVLEGLYKPLTDQIGERLRETPSKEFSVGVRRRGGWRDWLTRHDNYFDRRARTGVDLSMKQVQIFAEALGAGDDGSQLIEEIEKFAATRSVRNRSASPLKGGHSIVDIYDWLYDTEHISVDYALRYGGTDLSKLSPGTRGIVLLLLYLVVDDQDNRPLIIDQPEGNLDNSSVAEALVPFIRKSRKERQIILVSHNPNLVVVTDADQIIVSTADRPEELDHPILKYTSGAFEDIGDASSPHECTIRILEGGRAPFHHRAAGYLPLA